MRVRLFFIYQSVVKGCFFINLRNRKLFAKDSIHIRANDGVIGRSTCHQVGVAFNVLVAGTGFEPATSGL